jgi:Lipase maturation factor
MWFAGISPNYAQDWFVPLLTRLLEGDLAVVRLLRRNPFPDAPPVRVRARYYRYRFTTRRERRETGMWWMRELVGEYMPLVELRRSAAR